MYPRCAEPPDGVGRHADRRHTAHDLASPAFVNGSESLTIVLIILGGAILLGWLYLHTNGSVLPAMLMHASVNTAAQYFSSRYSGADLAQHTALLGGRLCGD